MAGCSVALIRGINVGKAKRVAMADLRALFEGLGFRDVRTLLNSGNVVFRHAGGSKARPGPQIELAMAKSLGVSARVTVLTAKEIADAVDDNPLLEIADDPSRLLVTVLASPADRKRLDPLAEQDWTPDRLAVGQRVAYLWCASGILESKLAAAVGKALGDAGTARNWATVLKLKGLVES